MDDVDEIKTHTFKENEVKGQNARFDKDINWEEVYGEFKEGIQSEAQELECSLSINKTERGQVCQNLKQSKYSTQ